MPTSKEILSKLVASAADKAPLGAFSTGIESNASVVGNLNSQHMYNQTPEKDNGFQKEAMNKYLTKLVRRNASDNVNLGLGVTGLGISSANYLNNRSNIEQDLERKRLEERSLQALNKINNNLTKATIVKAASLGLINKLSNKALNNLGKVRSTNDMVKSQVKVMRPKGISNV